MTYIINYNNIHKLIIIDIINITHDKFLRVSLQWKLNQGKYFS